MINLCLNLKGEFMSLSLHRQPHSDRKASLHLLKHPSHQLPSTPFVKKATVKKTSLLIFVDPNEKKHFFFFKIVENYSWLCTIQHPRKTLLRSLLSSSVFISLTILCLSGTSPRRRIVCPSVITTVLGCISKKACRHPTLFVTWFK